MSELAHHIFVDSYLIVIPGRDRLSRIYRLGIYFQSFTWKSISAEQTH